VYHNYNNNTTTTNYSYQLVTILTGDYIFLGLCAWQPARIVYGRRSRDSRDAWCLWELLAGRQQIVQCLGDTAVAVTSNRQTHPRIHTHTHTHTACNTTTTISHMSYHHSMLYSSVLTNNRQWLGTESPKWSILSRVEHSSPISWPTNQSTTTTTKKTMTAASKLSSQLTANTVW